MKTLIYSLLLFCIAHGLYAQNSHVLTIDELKELALCPDQNCFLAVINPWGFKYKGTKKGKLNKQEGTQYRYVRPYPNPLFAEATASYWIMGDESRRVVYTSDNRTWIGGLEDAISGSGFASAEKRETFSTDEEEFRLNENGRVWHLVWRRPSLMTETAPQTVTIYHDPVPPGSTRPYASTRPGQPTAPTSTPISTVGLSAPGANWDTGYPVQNVSDVLTAERTYATTYDRKNGKTGHTFFRVEKMRIQAKFLNQYRPMTSERWNTGFDLPLRQSGFDAFADNRTRLFQQEASFEVSGERIWMPTQELLIAPMQKLAKTGQTITLYALLVSYHNFGGTLHLSFLVNEYAVQQEQKPTAEESPYAHLLKETPSTSSSAVRSQPGSTGLKSAVSSKGLSGGINYYMRRVDRHYYRRNAKGDTIGTADAEFSFPEFSESKLNQLIRQKLVGTSTYEAKAQEVVDGYKEQITELKEEDLRGTMGREHRTEKVTVIGDTPHFLTLLNNHSTYGAGAAHGQYGEYYWLYDKQTKQFLTLSDLFSYSGLTHLSTAAEALFRRKEKLSTQASLCKNYLFDNCRFALAQQFRLDKKTLTFVYNPYEGKSFAAGIWTLSLPYSTIQAYFKPEMWLSIQREIIGAPTPNALPPNDQNAATVTVATIAQPENFEAFVQRFSADKDFQLSRVKFPFRKEGFYNYEEKPEVTLTQRTRWKHIDYTKPSSIGQGIKGVGNWTGRKENDKQADLKKLVTCGCEECGCGYFMHHEFRRIADKWFLVKEVLVSN